MSIANWIGIGQLTFALCIAWCAARLWLSRQPQIASRVCLVSLVLSTTLAIFMTIDVPRPLTYRVDAVSPANAEYGVIETGSGLEPDVTKITASNEQDFKPSAGGLGLRLDGKQLLESLSSLSRHSNEHPVFVRAIGLCILVGIVFQIFLIAFGTWELIRLRGLATDLTCSTVLAKLNQLCEQAGVLDVPQLRVHRFSLGAFVSWLEPRVIYLPSNYTTWTAEELNAALAHELMHVSRQDGFWRYVSRVCAGVLWFHPGAWLLYRELCLAQELSADRTASLLIPRSGYLVGLAKLGLRLDREERGRMPNLSVSVFTKDLIRRIEMLKQTQGRNSWASRGLAQATLAAVLSVCVTSFCWTVDADEEIRIASRVVDESAPSQQAGFQKPRLEPWQVVPAAKGYGAIRVANMNENAYLASLITLADEYYASRVTSSVLDASTVEAFQGLGVRLQNIAAVQMGIDMSLSSSTKTEDDGKTTKEKNYLSVGANQVVIDMIAPVDWRAVVDLLPVEQMTVTLNQSAGPIEQSALQELLDRLASVPSESKRFTLHTEPNCGDAVDSTLASVWRAVDGGIATFAIDYKASFKSDEEVSAADRPSGMFSMVSESTHESTDTPMSEDNVEAELEQGKLIKMISYIGLGVDHAAAPNELNFRVVCTPIEGVTVDELESQWKRFIEVAFQVLNSEAEFEDEYSKKLATQLLSMQCIQTSDADSIPPGIMLTGSVPLP